MYINYILIALGIWTLGLSFFVFKVYRNFSKLTKGVEIDLGKKGFDEVNKRLSALEKDGKIHVQKLGLVRFNPFKEIGGDQSFSLAILNGEDSGIIITGLHTRDRTRVYMKEVSGGKSGYDLSDEEKKALSAAYKK